MLPVIEVPTSKVTIPSTKKQLTLRPFKVKEEKILLVAKTSGQYQDILTAMKQVVQNCIIEKVDVNKLALFDLEYLFLKLRAMSVNNIVKVSYEDAEDKQIYDFDIDLNKIEVKFPETAIKLININDEYSLSMKYPEASLYSNKDFSSDNAIENLDVFLLHTVDKLHQGDKVIDLHSVSVEELKEFVNNLPVKAYEQIKEFWNTLPTLFHEIKYTNKAGKEQTITLKTLTDFFTL